MVGYVCRLGLKFDYYSEGSKSWLVIRKNAEEHSESTFKHTNIKTQPKAKGIWEQSLELQNIFKTK